MNFDFDIKKKRVKIMLVALIGFICYTFLPFVKVSGSGMSLDASFFSSDMYMQMIWKFFGDGNVFLSLVGLLCIAALVGIVVTGYMKKDNENLLCCFGGAAAGILSIITSLIKFGNLEDKLGASAGEGISIGLGQWLGVIALIACAAMAFLLPEDAE